MKPGRERARRFGQWAESLAVLLLRLKGYRILARGHVTGRGTGAGEIDIVAARGAVVAFVEVKARPTTDQAALAVHQRQRQRIIRAAEAFLARRPDLAGRHIRFDAVLVAPARLPCHIVDAWRMDA